MISEAQVLAVPVKHFRDPLGNAPCGTRRVRGVMSTRKEDRVTCPDCLTKLHAVTAQAATAAAAAVAVTNPLTRPNMLLAQNALVEAEVEFLRAAMREAWTILDGPGEQEAKIVAAKELLRRVPGAIPSVM